MFLNHALHYEKDKKVINYYEVEFIQVVIVIIIKYNVFFTTDYTLHTHKQLG